MGRGRRGGECPCAPPLTASSTPIIPHACPIACAAESLLSSAPTPALAQGALNVAAAALEALAGSTVEVGPHG